MNMATRNKCYSDTAQGGGENIKLTTVTDDSYTMSGWEY